MADDKLLGRPITRDEVKAAFNVILGMDPREADYAVVEAMGSTTNVLAEYLWDHWMGEPEHISVTRIHAEIIMKAVKS